MLLKVYYTLKNQNSRIFDTKDPSGTTKSCLNEIKLMQNSFSLYNFIVKSQELLCIYSI